MNKNESTSGVLNKSHNSNIAENVRNNWCLSNTPSCTKKRWFVDCASIEKKEIDCILPFKMNAIPPNAAFILLFRTAWKWAANVIAVAGGDYLDESLTKKLR